VLARAAVPHEIDPGGDDRKSEVRVTKKRQTFEKTRREQAVRERRQRKQERKEARQADKQAARGTGRESDELVDPAGSAEAP
jgi:hypothetical protein